MSDLQEFLNKHTGRFMPEPNTGCWLWHGGRTTAGYGHFYENGRQHYAHIRVCVLARGPLSTATPEVRHKCDTPACINPDHLIPGTHGDNMRDMHARGRANCPRGENKVSALLTDAIVTEARLGIARGGRPIDYARKYGVTSEAVRAAAAGETWAHVKTPTCVCVPQKGENCTHAILTAEQVREIRRLTDCGEQSHGAIAKRFGVSGPTISAIHTRRNWKSLPE